MIVTLKEPVTENTSNYAYLCEFGKSYFVYGVTRVADENDGYLINVYGGRTAYDVPASYFKILENTQPKDWVTAEHDVYGRQVAITSFPEFADDKFFYDKLMNEDEAAVSVFKKYAERYEAQVHRYSAESE